MNQPVSVSSLCTVGRLWVQTYKLFYFQGFGLDPFFLLFSVFIRQQVRRC